MCVCVCVCERERERERENKNKCRSFLNLNNSVTVSDKSEITVLNNRKSNQMDAKRQQELLAKLHADTLETRHVSAYLSAQKVAPI